MRRLAVGSLAFIASLATITVLPVYAAPSPEAVPVETEATAVDLGSVEDPASVADVQEGTTHPVVGVPDSAPTLTVTKAEVPSFSLVGVTWAADPAVTDVRVQVRVQEEDGAWGSWTEIGNEDAEQDEGTPVDAEARGGTAPLWTGPSTGVEVELVTRSGAAPTDVQLDLIDPNESDADTSLGTPDIQDTADAATAMPDVYSRGQWGADESIRTWDPEYPATIKAATLHHTADTNNYAAGDVPAMMRSIYRYHTVSRGWGDIGYNLIVDKYGRLWEGRYGGLSSTVVGAHAGGFNTGTFGVSMLGNYETAAAPQVMVNAVAAIIAWKFSLYGVDPYGSTTLTSGGGGTSRYAAGARVTLPTIFGHRDVGSTACPGRYGYARLPEIRNRVASLLTTSVTAAITQRYDSDPALRALLGSKTGYEQAAAGVVWQPYQGGHLYYTRETGVRLVRAGILGAYLRAGGPASLGAPTAEERGVGDGRGVVAGFQRGDVYWAETTGAHVVRGAIRNHWLSQGGPTGPLGYPVDDERGMPDGRGAKSAFERGSVYWSPDTGPVTTGGGIRSAYENFGGPSGVLGYPTEGETDVSGGRGRVQRFQRGSVYWTPVGQGAVVFGGIRNAWIAAGGEDGPMGVPTGNERPTADGKGSMQVFERGSVYWSAATGAHPVRGGMLGTWLASGAETGPNGYPTSAETASGDGRGQIQHFQRGSIHWTATTGAHVVRGAIAGIWLASGGTGGPLGYPTATERTTPNGNGQMQTFERGTVYWSASTGARIVRGDIAATYTAAGGSSGVLGLPTAEATATGTGGTGRVQTFQGGTIYWTSTGGAHVVRGGIGSAWLAVGGVDGRLGFPTTGESATATGAVQRFQGGAVTWTASSGRTAVTYR